MKSVVAVEKQKAKIINTPCLSCGSHEPQLNGGRPGVTWQSVIRNPSEVAYRTHCLSQCCLSSFPKNDSSPCSHTDTRFLSQPQAGGAATERGRGGKGKEMFDSINASLPHLDSAQGWGVRSLS